MDADEQTSAKDLDDAADAEITPHNAKKRRIIAAVTASLVVIAVIVAVAVTAHNDDDTKPGLADSASTTATPQTSLVQESTSSSSSSSQTPQTTVAPCVNSFDSKCGAQSWKPAPSANSPLTARILKQTPADPKKEDSVTITVRVEDADAPVGKFWVSDYQPSNAAGDFSQGTVFAHYGGDCAKRTTPYGTWTTPAIKVGSYDLSYNTMADYTGFPTYTIVEAASDLCSFVRYENGKAVDLYETSKIKPLFNPYADWKVWSVCVDKTYHFSIADRGKCPEDSLRN